MHTVFGWTEACQTGQAWQDERVPAHLHGVYSISLLALALARGGDGGTSRITGTYMHACNLSAAAAILLIHTLPTPAQAVYNRRGPKPMTHNRHNKPIVFPSAEVSRAGAFLSCVAGPRWASTEHTRACQEDGAQSARQTEPHSRGWVSSTYSHPAFAYDMGAAPGCPPLQVVSFFVHEGAPLHGTSALVDKECLILLHVSNYWIARSDTGIYRRLNVTDFVEFQHWMFDTAARGAAAGITYLT